MVRLRTLDDVDVAGKRVLVRADLNVPLSDGRVSDTTRLDRIVPTIEELAKKGARVVVLSHFGRPKKGRDAALSLRPIAEALAALAPHRTVVFADDCVGEPAEQAVAQLAPGQIAVLENLRFHAGEEANDPGFATQLARLGDLYVDDAFSCAHRAHASIDALARALPSVAGRALALEVEMLSSVLDSPRRPMAAVVGGAKISTKLAILENLVSRVDVLAVGGAMANTFLMARGIEVGRSLVERDQLDTARAIARKADSVGCALVLPDDVVVAAEFKAGAPSQTVATTAVPGDAMILDIGPASARSLADRLAACRTLVWNGPLGAFEIEPFDRGTTAVAQAAAALTREGKLLSVAGGGETVAALRHAGAADDFSYLSTAGGAFLEWLEGRTLPGVAVLTD